MTDSCNEPVAVRVVEVVLVDFQRGEGDMRRGVQQVYSKDGDLLAEHDQIHSDPVYASFFLRERITPEWLRIWSGESTAVAEVAHG